MLDSDPVLGTPIANYPSNRARLLIPAVVVVGVVSVILNFTVAEIEGWGPPLTILIMGVITMAAGWWVLHYWNREVILYGDGFSYREGGKDVYFLYAEIASIRQRAEQLAYFGGLIRRVNTRFTLTTIRGETMTFTTLYSSVERLGAHLEQKVNESLEPHLAKKISEGEKIAFSDTLKLSRAGLHEGSRDLAWEQFGGYKVGGGKLTLWTRDGEEWFRLALREIDNIPILLHFLRQHQPTVTVMSDE
jgi:hypothetical protein